AYGPPCLKRRLWNHEFSSGQWDCLDSTPGDCVYPFTEKYVNGGSILDLGCGSGSTGNELDATKYQDYTGIDLSNVAIEKARRKTEENKRGEKNRYHQSDIFTYVPTKQYDVILFRDSIYYVDRAKIVGMLNRYAQYLKKEGTFLVRMWNGAERFRPIVDAIES